MSKMQDIPDNRTAYGATRRPKREQRYETGGRGGAVAAFGGESSSAGSEQRYETGGRGGAVAAFGGESSSAGSVARNFFM